MVYRLDPPGTDDDDSVGVTNYVLPVYAATCTTTTTNLRLHQPPKDHETCPEECKTPHLLLWFFDSRGGWEYQQHTTNPTNPTNPPTHANATGRVGRPNWVHPDVASWFKNTSAAITRNNNQLIIPQMAFMHIPTSGFLEAQKRGIDPSLYPGINDDSPLSIQAQGWCPDGTVTQNDSCKYGGHDRAIMQALTSTPGMMAVFAGHDHGDTWCYNWDGKYTAKDDSWRGGVSGDPLPMNTTGKGDGNINLCFGQHTGYGGYGKWKRGARQVVASLEKLKQFTLDTHIRLEGGAVIGAVSLNATYGQDKYPTTPNDKDP